MLGGERVSQLRHYRIVLEALDAAHLRAFARHRKGDARARRRAVDLDGARAAHAMLAAEVGAGQALALAQEVREVCARLDLRFERAAVDGQRDLLHAAIRCIARRSATACSWRL